MEERAAISIEIKSSGDYEVDVISICRIAMEKLNFIEKMRVVDYLNSRVSAEVTE